MPVKNVKRRTNDGFEGTITGLTDEEKNILNQTIATKYTNWKYTDTDDGTTVTHIDIQGSSEFIEGYQHSKEVDSNQTIRGEGRIECGYHSVLFNYTGIFSYIYDSESNIRQRCSIGSFAFQKPFRVLTGLDRFYGITSTSDFSFLGIAYDNERMPYVTVSTPLIKLISVADDSLRFDKIYILPKYNTSGSLFLVGTDNEETSTIKSVKLFSGHKVLVPGNDTNTEILPCSTADNGKVLSVVNGEAQWASAGGGGGGVGIIDISSMWSAITPTDFKSLKFKSYLVGNMIYIEIKAIFKNRPETAKDLFQNTTYIIPEDVTLPFFDGQDVKRITGSDNKKLYIMNPVDSYSFYMSGWFTIEA